jgi:hypothetical protein
MTPAWILDMLAALMLTVAAVSAARLVAARPWQHGSVVVDTDVAHLLMAIAMAGMLTARLTTLPGGAWEVIFGLMTAWFAIRVVLDARLSGARALAGGHCAPHLVHSAAMVYTFLALTGPVAGAGGTGAMHGMSGMSGEPGGARMPLDHPTLAFIFALSLIGYGVWDLDQLSGRRYAFGSPHVAAVRGGPRRMALAGADLAQTAAPGQGTAARTARSGREFTDQAAPSGPEPADSRAAGPAAARLGGFLLSPAVTIGARIAMGVTMAFMLLVAI